MEGEWKTICLGDLTTWTSGGTPSKANPEFWKGDIPWISASSMKTPLLCDSDLKITRGGLENGSRLAETGSILLLVRGSELHKRIPVGIATCPVAFNQDVKALKSKGEIDPRYLFYWLLGNEGMLLGKVEPTGIGAGKLDTEVLKSLPVALPPVVEQKAIVAVLKAFDDKIELNRRMNATLEATARALFRSWFVDFDPVRAKLEGRQPVGVDAATAALFPEHLEDSPLGPIPKGWEARPLAEMVDVVKGRSYRSEELAESKTALVTLKSFLRGGGYRADGLKPFAGEYKTNQRVCSGDLIVAFTDVTQAADVIGKPALIRSDERFDTLVASLDVGIVRPKSRHVSTPFLYCLFLAAEFQAHAYSHVMGTTVLHLGSNAIPSFVSITPPVEVAEKFAERAGQIFRLIDENAKQSRTLATLRDTLLPKLLSGEVKVGVDQ